MCFEDGKHMFSDNLQMRDYGGCGGGTDEYFRENWVDGETS